MRTHRQQSAASAVLREISESGGDYEVVMVDRVGLTRNSSEFKRYNPKDWRNAS